MMVMNFWVGIGLLIIFVALMVLIPFHHVIVNHFYFECIVQGGIPSGTDGHYTCRTLFAW
jgi:formate/nitrite transporter FocA (FNT family)